MGEKLTRAGSFSIRASDDARRVLSFVGTDETLDRYNTIIKADGWQLDEFRKNPVFLWCHDASQPPIGKVLDVQYHVRQDKAVGKVLVFDVQFPPLGVYKFADLVYDLYKADIMRAVSVGFRNLSQRPASDEDREMYGLGKDQHVMILDRNELYELSAVPVPGNPNALKEGIDGFLAVRGMVRLLPMTAVDEKSFGESLEKIRKHFIEEEALAKQISAALDSWRTGKTDEEKRAGFTCPKPFDSHAACVAAMEGKDVEDPDAFCAAWAAHCGEKTAPAEEEIGTTVPIFVSSEGATKGVPVAGWEWLSKPPMVIADVKQAITEAIEGLKTYVKEEIDRALREIRVSQARVGGNPSATAQDLYERVLTGDGEKTMKRILETLKKRENGR